MQPSTCSHLIDAGSNHAAASILASSRETNEEPLFNKLVERQCAHSRHSGQALWPSCRCCCCLHAFYLPDPAGKWIYLDCARAKLNPGQSGELSSGSGGSVIPEVVGLPVCHSQSPASPPPKSPRQQPPLFAYQWLCSSPDGGEMKGFTVDETRRSKNPARQTRIPCVGSNPVRGLIFSNNIHLLQLKIKYL